MAPRYDVAARLAEGREAVAHTQAYVSACHRRGYGHPDLTGYDGQLADRYDSEAGLDLQRLDADCAALAALAGAAEDALRRQHGQLDALAAAWRGPGADAATEFVRRHCEAGAQLTARLRAAATGCEVLRDELWRLVDTKVAAVTAVDDRAGAHRPAWLAAAQAVNSGSGDEHAAEVIEKQLIPYVDHDVRGEWVPAVQSARDGVAGAYRAAAGSADPAPGTVFPVPGDLGPVVPPDHPTGAAPAVPATAAPVAAEIAPASDVAPAGVPAAPDGRQDAAVPEPAAALADMPADPALPAGLGLPGDLGLPTGGLPAGGGLGGLGGLIPRLADAFGDPGSSDGFGDPFEDRAATDDRDPDDHEDPEPDDSEGDPPDEPGDEAVVEEAAAEDSGEPTESESAPSDPETEAGAQAEPAAETTEADDSGQSPEPSADGAPKTPCEVAAEQLPQVGQ